MFVSKCTQPAPVRQPKLEKVLRLQLQWMSKQDGLSIRILQHHKLK